MTAPQGQAFPPTYGAPPLASWGARVGAYLVDGIVIALPYIIFVAIGGAVGGGTRAFLLIIGVLWAIGAGIYNRWVLGGKTGQTWGRQVFKIRLIGERTGQPIGVGLAFVRDIAHMVDSLICYIGWLFPLWDAKKQTLADKIMQTVVVRS